MNFAGRGEMIPNKDTWCEIDPAKTDAYGIPVLRFHFTWSQHEINQIRHMQDTFTVDHPDDGRPGDGARGRTPNRAISTGGTIIHEAGTVRMGNDPKTSVLNKLLPVARREEPVRMRRGADGQPAG